MTTTTQDKARQALLDIQRYLADEIAPLMAVDAAKTLLRMPPKYGAVAIEHWLESQLSAPNSAVTVSSYLYHAVKKMHLFSECKLVNPAAMNQYVTQLSQSVTHLCPEREQAELRLRLSRIGEAEIKLSAPVRLLNRELGSEAEEQRIKLIEEEHKQTQAQSDSDAEGKGSQVLVSPRVAMLMERLETQQRTDPQQKDATDPDETMVNLLSRAAIDAGDSAQFESSLAQVRQLGIEPKLDHVFRQLGKQLPGWEVDLKQGHLVDEASLGHLLKAMHRIVSLAGTSEEGVDRFGSMIYAAIEQLNDGHLAQAVSMFDVAQRLIDEEKVDAQLASLVKTRAQGSVSLAALRKFASTTGKHGLLRNVLNFFQAFSPSSLLERLDGESKRNVRKLILSLLEVLGPPCRPELLDRLARYQKGVLPDPGAFYSRNVVFLLRRIPRVSEDDLEQELELLSAHSLPEQPFMVTKEAVGALALLTEPKAERILLDRLAAFEYGAVDGSLPYAQEETLEMLERTCAALARLGTPNAVQAVVDHGFRNESQLGDTLRHLQHLGTWNLNRHPVELRKLIDGLRKLLPAKVLGVFVGGKTLDVSYLVRALSGTPEPEVKALFKEIVERFAGREFAEQASEGLARFDSKAVPENETGQAISGDLQLFELPNLLQSIADSKQTGRLIVSDTNGSDRAVMLLSDGKVHHCENGRLRGLDAVCHLFERPQPGTFRLKRISPDQAQSPDGTVLDVFSTILEAMRRHDEFQQDRAIVPDGSSLMPGDAKPSMPESEKDAAFARNVWAEAVRGTAPETCEGTVGDAYRIRRLYLHWLESGALSLRPTA